VSGLVHQVEYFVLYSFFGRVFEFAVGIFVAQSFNTQRSGWLYSIPKPTTVGLLLFGLGSYIISGRPTWDPIGFTGVAFGLPIAVGLIFFGLISESTGVSRVLSTPVMNLLGRTSYIYYLIHVGPISVFFVGILTHFIPTMQDIVLRRVVMFIFLNLLALFIFRFLEEPVGRWIRGSIKASVKKPTA
jgi:peptidoglycan/LPS O-acetylase OafA/YrhL